MKQSHKRSMSVAHLSKLYNYRLKVRRMLLGEKALIKYNQSEEDNRLVKGKDEI